MAYLTQNAQYLVYNGVQIQAKLVEVKITQENAAVDVTAGIQGHEQIAAGRYKHTYSIKLAYEIGNPQLSLFRPGTIATMEYGPEGATTGKPKHLQSVHISSVSAQQSARIEMVTLDIAGEGSDTPTTDMFNGGAY